MTFIESGDNSEDSGDEGVADGEEEEEVRCHMIHYIIIIVTFNRRILI